MKRGLLLSLSAMALLAVGTSVHAQTVDISLNLRYDDPANLSEGGKYYLVVKTTPSANNLGVAGLSAYITGIDDTGVGAPVFGNAALTGRYAVVTQANIGANVNTPGNTPFKATLAGNVVNIVYGQNNAVGGAVLAGVGTPTFGSRYDLDPLYNGPPGVDWDDSTVLISGRFGAVRPAFVSAGANSTDANVLASTTLGTPATDAAVTLAVRGDAVIGLAGGEGGGEGLKLGDANRDFATNIGDFAILQNNFNGSGKGWDTGDWNNDGNANIGDFALLQNNFNQTSPPPTVGAVPEPASLVLAGLSAICGLAIARRRLN